MPKPLLKDKDKELPLKLLTPTNRGPQLLSSHRRPQLPDQTLTLSDHQRHPEQLQPPERTRLTNHQRHPDQLQPPDQLDPPDQLRPLHRDRRVPIHIQLTRQDHRDQAEAQVAARTPEPVNTTEDETCEMNTLSSDIRPDLFIQIDL